MTYVATITSKRQFTIPSQLFKEIGFSKGDRVLVEEKNGELHIKSAIKLVDQLAGSVTKPKHVKETDLDNIIKNSKEKYFKRK